MRFLWVIFFLSLAFYSIGQRYSFIQYSTPEGLPQSQVNGIAQDCDGYLWVGTFGGLSRFNGREFKNFGTKHGLLNNRVLQVYVDSNILILGHDNGISFSNNKTDFESIIFDGTFNVSDIIVYNNRYYITTNGGGLFVFSPANHSLEEIKGSPERIRGAAIYENKLFLATREGIFNYESISEAMLRDERFTEDSYSDIKVLDNKLFATIYEGVCYQLENNIVSIFTSSDQFRFRKICATQTGIWLSSSQGVLLKDKNEEIRFSEITGLPVNNISTVFRDAEGNYWLGSSGKGLLKFTGKTFTHFNRNNGMPSDLVTSILKDNRGDFWLSSYDKGVIKMSSNGQFTALNYPEMAVWNSAQLGSTIYFGSNYGLFSYTNNSWKEFYTEDGLPTNRITGLFVDKRGRLFVGTSGGLAILKNNTFHEVESNSSIDIQNVRSFCEIDNKIYLATQRGLKVYTDGKIELVEKFDYPVNSIIQTDGDKLWIGTENGLFILENNKVREVEIGDKTGARYINFLVGDNEFVYAGTNNGLLEINTIDESIETYGINAGLIDLETNLNSGYLDKNGIIWFGTASGLMRFDTKLRTDQFYSTKPKLHLKSFLLNFEQHDKKLMLLNQQHKIVLGPNENNLLFEFDGIFLSNPESVRYTYFLNGITDDWSPGSSSNSLNFNNLPPGNYELRVKAAVIAGLSSEELSIQFEIKPPFYRSWWFLMLLMLLALLIIYLIDKVRIQRIEQRNYRNNLEISNKLSRLEQQSLNASMNRHFIFNALNSIQYFINSSDKQSANRYLTRFAKLIRKNLDSSHLENGMVPLSDELERLELYLQLESMRFGDKFDYTISIDPIVDKESLKVPAMFLQPFVENSIIHGVLPLTDKKGLIEIKVTDHLDHIRIEIFDNGIGIDNSILQKSETPGDHESHGMRITMGRIKLLQEISERSVELIGPRQINKNNSTVKGTIVTFKFLKQYLEN